MYRAWHEHYGRMHALKVLRHAHAEDERLRQALLFEGGLLHSMPKHPALLEVHAVAVDPLTKIEVLALELLDGVDLREHLRCRKRGLGVIEATSLAVHVAATLGFLHKHGIVHSSASDGWRRCWRGTGRSSARG